MQQGVQHPAVLAGIEAADDAAIVAIDEKRCLVSSLDFFPALVDDPIDFGRIAATNALSDIYATGATPVFALAIAGFPAELPGEVIRLVHSGACDVLASAATQLAGGHTIRLSEPVFGLAVTGFAERDQLWKKSGAQPGDRLLISKAIGTGVLLAEGSPTSVRVATAAMLETNRKAAEVLHGSPLPPNAVTDITGFGLIGHAAELAQASQVSLVIEADAVPCLDGALDAAAAGCKTSNDHSNRQTKAQLTVADTISKPSLVLLSDPQTAGGLLVSAAPTLADALTRRGFFEIGQVVAGEPAVHLN